MPEILIVTLLVILALLSKPGLITKNLLSGTSLTTMQSLIHQRGVVSILMLAVIAQPIIKQPFWLDMTPGSSLSLVLIVLLVPPLSFLLVRLDQNSEPHAIYTGLQIGTPQWTVYMISTSVYMVAYEILLRGILLHYLTEWIGIILAIGINALIYGAMHLVKGLREAILCVPLGVFLCWITLYTKSVWPAAILHLIMALCFELFYNAKRTHVNV